MCIRDRSYGIHFPPLTDSLMKVLWNIGRSKNTCLDGSYTRCLRLGGKYQITAYQRLYNRRIWIFKWHPFSVYNGKRKCAYESFIESNPTVASGTPNKPLQPIRVWITNLTYLWISPLIFDLFQYPRACGLPWPRFKLHTSKFGWKWNRWFFLSSTRLDKPKYYMTAIWHAQIV